MDTEAAIVGTAPPPPQQPTTPDADHALWQFGVPATPLAPGWYYIQATWVAAADQATDAQYQFYDGGTLSGQASVNQQIAPSGPTYDDWVWQVLATVYIRNGSAAVQLNGQATGFLVADAMCLAPVENDVEVQSLDESLGTDEVTVHVLVNVVSQP